MGHHEKIYECPRCKDMGVVDIPGKENTLRKCDCIVERRIAKKNEELPLNYRGVYDASIPENIKGRVHDFIRDPGAAILYLSGPTSIGKTFVARIIEGMMIRRGKSTIWVSSTELNTIFQNSVSGEGKEKNKAMQDRSMMMDVEWLFIDDFARSAMTEHVAACMRELADGRRGKTILTSNYPLVSTKEYKGLSDAQKIKSLNYRVADIVLAVLLWEAQGKTWEIRMKGESRR